MPRTSSKNRISMADMEAALRVHPQMIGTLVRAKVLVEKLGRLDRVERAHLEQGKSTARYEEAQIEVAKALEALRQSLTLIPMPEVPYP